jgi:hypothetical protein
MKQFEVMKYLIDELHIDPNQVNEVFESSFLLCVSVCVVVDSTLLQDGCSILFIACARGHVDIVRHLLNQWKVNSFDPNKSVSVDLYYFLML